MDRPIDDETAPLTPTYGIPSSVRDNRQPNQKRLAVYVILTSTLFERIAYYALSATLAITADPIQCPSSKGPIAALIFTGTSNISTVIFAVISDWKLGRAKTIIVGFILYLVGYVSMIVSTSGEQAACSVEKPIYDDQCTPWLIPALVVIAIGAGAVQANMAVFGAEQIQEEQFTARFFDKYVFSVNLGAILAKAVFFYLQPSPDVYYSIPYIYGASALLFAALLFLICYPYYIHVRADETVITKCIPVLINALQTRHRYWKNKAAEAKQRKASVSSSVAYNSRVSSDEEDSVRLDLQIPTFLDYAKATNQGRFIDRIVEDVKSLRGALVVFILLIPFWLIYDQLNSTFRLQAKHMRGTDDNAMVIVSLADPVILIVGLMILNIFVYKYLEGGQKLFTVKTKLVTGMCFGVITMCVAGTVEKVRQDQWASADRISNLLIYNQIPQNLCMGLAELFVMVASFEFAYFAAPRSAQTLFMSLRFFSIGLSSFIGSGYIAAFQTESSSLDFTCPSESDDRWRYSTYFYILAGVQFVFILLFIVCQNKYEIIKPNRQHIAKGRFFRHSSFSIVSRN